MGYFFDGSHGAINDIRGTNWYTSSSLLPHSTFQCWNGSSNGWKTCEYDLDYVPDLIGKNRVQFRFVFNGDHVINSHGFLIDNFEIN